MRAGDPVVFADHEPELGLTTGTRGTLIAVRAPDVVDITADDGREFTTDLSSLQPANTNAADSAT